MNQPSNVNIFSWMDSTCFAQVVRKYGNVFSDDDLTPRGKEEEEHYLYYYGETKCQPKRTAVNPYTLEDYSHEKIAISLLLLAISTKYWQLRETGEWENIEQSEELDQYLKLYPVEVQANKCKNLLESMSVSAGGTTDNPFCVSKEHVKAYQTVFTEICSSLRERGLQLRLKLKTSSLGNLEIKKSAQSAGYQACMLFLKGFVSVIMEHENATELLAIFASVTIKEPNYYFWWHTRFLIERHFCEVTKNKSGELLRYVTNAYTFSPESMKVRTGLNLIMAENTHSKLNGGDGKMEKGSWNRLELARLRSKLESPDPSNLHRKWTSIKMSELYISAGKAGMKEENPENVGKGILELCLSQYPSCHLVIDALAALQEKSPSWNSRCKLECPVVWIPTYEPATSTVRKYGSVWAYLKSRLEKPLPYFTLNSNSSDQDHFDDACPLVSKREEWVCAKICLASLALHYSLENTYLTNSQECLVALEEDDTLEIPTSHCKVYKYILDATRVHHEFQKSGAHGKNYLERGNEVQKIIEGLKMDWESVKDSATVHYVKGQLATLLGVAWDVPLTEYRKAAELEPHFYLWKQMLYETLKQSRRKSSGLRPPSSEEIDACKQAHILNPQKLEYSIDLASLKLEILKCSISKQRKEKNYAAEESEIFFDLLSDVITRSPEKSRYAMLAKLKMAEFFYSTRIKGLPGRTEEAEVMIKECLTTWPKSSTVLHRVARFYRYDFGVFMKSLPIYKEAMSLSPTNFPCLMDYLKLLGKKLKDYKEMVDIIDKCLPKVKHPESTVTLLIIKGQACWLQNEKKKACYLWVEAFVNFKWLAFKVKEALISKRSATFGKLDISLSEMCPCFKKWCRLVNKSAGNEALQDFLLTLERAVMARNVTKSSARNTLFQAIAPQLNKK